MDTCGLTSQAERSLSDLLREAVVLAAGPCCGTTVGGTHKSFLGLDSVEEWIAPPSWLGHKVARFREINKDQRNVHHDALELPDGQIVLVTKLREGQHATVLQLPASPVATPIKTDERALLEV